MRVALAFAAIQAALCASVTLKDGEVTAILGPNGLTNVTIGSLHVDATELPWNMGTLNNASAVCSSTSGPVAGVNNTASISFKCGTDITASVEYSIIAGKYIRKRMFATSPIDVNTTNPLAISMGMGHKAPIGSVVAVGHKPLGAFVRFAQANAIASTLWVALQAPFGTYTIASDGGVNMEILGLIRLTIGEKYHLGDVLIGGVTVNSWDKMPAGGSLYQSEMLAIKNCARHFFTGNQRTTPITFNVAWDENDYTIDMATTDGQLQYQRIVKMNAILGNEYLTFAPTNSDHSDRWNPREEDGWGWEHLLWFSMEKPLRQGLWDPKTDYFPADIKQFIDWGATLGVKMCAYVYPCMPFAELAQWPYKISDNMGNTLDMSNRYVQDWMINTMDSFLDISGGSGFAFDHAIWAGDGALQYSQYMGFTRIRREIVARHPDMVFDNRQTAHDLGPFYLLENGYQEPLAGDENPETYGIPLTSWNTDVVAANFLRQTNYFYTNKDLIPMERMPGMIGHQTERTADNGTDPCQTIQLGTPCFNWNRRDFDLLGYRFSYISTVGTGGLNLMWAMIPARDEEEFNLFPEEDRLFVRKWRQFAFDNIDVLRNTATITSLGAPAFGSVDGTHAIKNCSGFLFLYNPGFTPLDAVLDVDNTIGLHCSDTADGMDNVQWKVSAIYPQEKAVGVWTYGGKGTVTVPGQGAVVVSVEKCDGNCTQPRVSGAEVEGDKLRGARGSTVTVHVKDLSVLPATCKTVVQDGSGGGVVNVTFVGEELRSPMSAEVEGSLAVTDVWYNFSASITAEMQNQLKARRDIYTLPWSESDYKAPWLVPSRLPLYLPFAVNDPAKNKITAYINNATVGLEQAGTSRGARSYPRTFTGFWWNATDLVDVAPSTVQVALYNAAGWKEQQFFGAFWQNFVEEYTTDIASC